MDVSAKEITFDDQGRCNFCTAAFEALAAVGYRHGESEDLIRPNLPDLKTTGRYDAIIGLSGGADSATALEMAVKFGLRVLAFSVDNGWNSSLADENIMKLVEGMKVPFYRYVIDIPKFRDLQSAFLKSGVRNIEIPTDHILMAVSYELAAKYKIKTILSGGNVETESIMPASWGYNARDLTHIKAIYKKFTGRNLKGLPTCSLLKWNWYRWVKKISIVYLLDYMPYNREVAIMRLGQRFGYKHPGEKHCESVWTNWFQNFYLFEKFGIDKRKAHLSSLIVSGQITRQEALHELQKNPVYPELGIEKKVMGYERHEHSDYPMGHGYELIAKLIKYAGIK